MTYNTYIEKLGLILNFNPAWTYGSASPQAQLHMLGKILTADLDGDKGAVLMECALNLARWAWQDRPLDPELISLLHMLVEAGADFGPLNNVIKDLFKALDPSWNNSYAVALENEPDFLAEFLSKLPDFTAKKMIEARYQAQQGIVHDTANAENAIMDLPSDLFGNYKAAALMELGHKLGQNTVDSGIFKTAWHNAFWHSNFTLALYDILYPVPEPAKGDLSERGLPPILLYSWNKRDVLAGTLDSLRNSGTQAPVYVLDNGSTDGTYEMLLEKQATWGTKFEIIKLSTNIGAPAARNWLLSLPEVKKAHWAVFLDDDVILEPGWLDGLIKVAIANPGFGAVGCRVTDHISPFGIQTADFFLLDPAEATRSFEDLEEQIFPFCSGMGQTAEAMYSYTRACVSVTGCCHLLNMQAVHAAGPFDVRFNPSQFDDFERDIRSSIAGWPTYYAGQVCIRHLQHSSLRQAISVPQQAHIMGNKMKLEFLQNKQQLAQMRKQALQVAREDLLRKAAKVQVKLGL